MCIKFELEMFKLFLKRRGKRLSHSYLERTIEHRNENLYLKKFTEERLDFSETLIDIVKQFCTTIADSLYDLRAVYNQITSIAICSRVVSR
jgi:hypothetical protein